jgi:acetyl esterase/lipase
MDDPLPSKSGFDNLGIPRMVRAEAPPLEPDAIPLTPCEKVMSAEIWHKVGDVLVVRNVSQPTLTPFFPDMQIATGTAVIVAPGGAFTLLSIGHEGWPIARRLADNGIAAFVLKYRVNETPADDSEFYAMLRERMAGVVTSDTTKIRPLSEPRSTEDAHAAVRLIRANAATWRIDPARVGLMGFSAGAIVAVNAAISGTPEDHPNFIAPFYPSLEPREVPMDAPPMFAAVAFDDMYFGRQGLGLVDSWRRAGRPVEFHGFQNGGHGFGLGKAGTSSALVYDQFLLWLHSTGML